MSTIRTEAAYLMGQLQHRQTWKVKGEVHVLVPQATFEEVWRLLDRVAGAEQAELTEEG